eukprot:27598-Pelagomonas_calceolata.AAC.1
MPTYLEDSVVEGTHGSSEPIIGVSLCPDTNPFITLERAATQHSRTITRLQTRSSRNPNRNNKVALHIILIGVDGNIYNEYTITHLMNLGLTKQKSKSLASKFRDHAIQRLTNIINTRHVLCLHGGFWGGVLGVRRRRTGEGESGRPGP